MSRHDSSLNISESLGGFIDSVCKLGVYVGTAALVVGVIFLIYTSNAAAESTKQVVSQAASNIDTFGQVAIIGGLVASLCVTWLWWGEETLGPLLLIVGGALYFSTSYLPGLIGELATDTSFKAIGAISTAGVPIFVIGAIDLLVDLVNRMRLRAKEGAKADQLKFGKGIKEEKDIRNVFLGKCWQLPYCRKFVRERCPIYHSRRTCWQERVGCMCEEAVIQNAMEGKVIPSDIVAAAKFIPRNSKLTPGQKAERCRQCVIYNEHQKHKYKASMVIAAVGTVALFLILHEPLKAVVQGWLVNADSAVGKATFKTATGVAQDLSKSTSVSGGVIPYAEIVLVALFLIFYAYLVRFLEFMFFKMKA